MKLLNALNGKTAIAVLAVVAFPALVFIQYVTFYMLPFLVPLLTGMVVAVYGVLLSAGVLWRLWSERRGIHLLAAAPIALTWLACLSIPIQDFAVQARFRLERSSYDRTAAMLARGETPACVSAHECMTDDNDVPYLVFPFPGSLSGWIGIVYVPEPGRAPDVARLKSLAADAGCNPQPLAPHYYICGFY